MMTPWPYDVFEDSTEDGPSAPPSMLVRTNRKDGSPVYLPAYFEVKAGETYSNLLTREGDREFRDPASDASYTLWELYAMTEVDAQATIGGIGEALAPLKDLTLRVDELHQVHEQLKESLGAEGIARLERDHAGAPAAAPKLAVVNLRGVGLSTPLGEEIANMPLADVAAMKREDFVRKALERAQPGKEARAERLAKEVWTRATYVVSVAENWRDR